MPECPSWESHDKSSLERSRSVPCLPDQKFSTGKKKYPWDSGTWDNRPNKYKGFTKIASQKPKETGTLDRRFGSHLQAANCKSLLDVRPIHPSLAPTKSRLKAELRTHPSVGQRDTDVSPCIHNNKLSHYCPTGGTPETIRIRESAASLPTFTRFSRPLPRTSNNATVPSRPSRKRPERSRFRSRRTV